MVGIIMLEGMLVETLGCWDHAYCVGWLSCSGQLMHWGHPFCVLFLRFAPASGPIMPDQMVGWNEDYFHADVP